jgi:penicillin-binding protein
MRMIKMLICVLTVVILTACAAGPQAVYDVNAWVTAMAARDYEAMWAQVDPAVDIDKDSFINKYDAIFSGLGVKEITIDNIIGPDENGFFTYTATYKTQDYGDFESDYSLQMISGGEGSRVYWNYSLIFPDMEPGSSVQIQTLNATRGEIFAEDGSLLARNAYADTLYMDVSKVKDIVGVAEVVCPLTGMTPPELADIVYKAKKQKANIIKLDAFFANELREDQKQSILSVPGLGIDDEMYTPIRDYPLADSAAHIVGYTGFLSEENLPEGYEISDRVGVAGLEAAYETQLRGKDGKIIYIEDKWGKNIRTLWEVPMEQGQDLRLTIKPDLQKRAYEALKNNLILEEGQSGVAIVMDAATGSVEAMASFPSFDDNVFTFSLSDDMFNYLFKSDFKPLMSLATQEWYPPGSVIKPFSATAALEAGVITTDSEFDGVIVDNKWQTEDKTVNVTRINENAGSPLMLPNALKSSDNIYFAWAALRLGADKLMDYYERIGFKQDVLFDLPVKTSSVMNTGSMMTKQMLADMGYGQGELVVTPLQMASMYTAFANQTGDIMQPVLVKKICRADGLDYVALSDKEPSVWVDNAVSQSSLDTLTPMMKEVIDHGTGYAVRQQGVSLPIPMAGKTGTAEMDKTREISWFACYWLDGYYDRLVLVMVDVATEKGPVKFTIASELLAP